MLPVVSTFRAHCSINQGCVLNLKLDLELEKIRLVIYSGDNEEREVYICGGVTQWSRVPICSRVNLKWVNLNAS